MVLYWFYEETKSGELGLFRRSYIHELPSHLSSKSRNAQQALVMDEQVVTKVNYHMRKRLQFAVENCFTR